MQNQHNSRHCKFASFSGIDGAGKSTQIANLRARLQDAGMRVALITFWDDVARLKGIREGAGHTLFKGEKGVGSPEKPVNRRDKNVRSWPMSLVRLGLYFVDALSPLPAVPTRQARATSIRNNPRPRCLRLRSNNKMALRIQWARPPLRMKKRQALQRQDRPEP